MYWRVEEAESHYHGYYSVVVFYSSCAVRVRFGNPVAAADGIGASLSSIAIYVLMAAVLIWRPRGLFQAYG